jgi:hypothetical protein
MGYPTSLFTDDDLYLYSNDISNSLTLEVLCHCRSSSSVNADDDGDEQDRSSDSLDDEKLKKVSNEQHRSDGVKLS